MDRPPSRDGPCPRGEAANREEAHRQWKEAPNASGAITDESSDQDYLKTIELRPAGTELGLRECLTIREKKLPDDWSLFNTKSMMGGARWPGRRISRKPNRSIVEGHSGMKEREAKMPPAAKTRLPEAIRRLVDLYTAWERPEQAEKWRVKMEEMKSDNQ